ncbi:MAG: hypothetical protein ABI782_08620, partial [Anaerolineaceae bacterium]
TNPASCELALYRLPASASDAEYYRASICGPGRGNSWSCISLADSRSWKTSNPDQNGLPPTEHDNFFQLAGPILTGSDDVGSNWNPGEPVTINHWNEVRAEFKDDAVKGIITTRQLVWDTVNGQVVNKHVITVQVAFEAVKQK